MHISITEGILKMLTSELTSVVRGTAKNIFGCVDTYIKIGYDNFLIIYYYTHTESLNMIYILFSVITTNSIEISFPETKILANLSLGIFW